MYDLMKGMAPHRMCGAEIMRMELGSRFAVSISYCLGNIKSIRAPHIVGRDHNLAVSNSGRILSNSAF